MEAGRACFHQSFVNVAAQRWASVSRTMYCAPFFPQSVPVEGLALVVTSLPW
jgi:hypothetical protein